LTDWTRIQKALEANRAVTLSQRDQLRRDLDGVIAAQTDIATDDEHDPEGATIAYERSRLSALVDQADTHLVDIASAIDRVAAGTYGSCERCAKPIGAERLEARPTVRTCITCAR
jgi:RNA polymerase-binding transcription factor DksA